MPWVLWQRLANGYWLLLHSWRGLRYLLGIYITSVCRSYKLHLEWTIQLLYWWSSQCGLSLGLVNIVVAIHESMSIGSASYKCLGEKVCILTCIPHVHWWRNMQCLNHHSTKLYQHITHLLPLTSILVLCTHNNTMATNSCYSFVLWWYLEQ